MNNIGVGIIGFGTVGAGVVDGLLRNGDLIRRRTDLPLYLKRVADKDLAYDRGMEVDPELLTDDADAVLDDPEIQIVVELVGGTGVAADMILSALRNGKSVVTANKALLAERGEELYAAAEENHADLFYEASVAGGIPIIRSLREGLIGNHIEAIYGILNGTCNYILTRMEAEPGVSFWDVLSDAQAAGYAEAEPGLDIDGFDTAHKTAVLASLAYGFPLRMDDLSIEGIRDIDPIDITFARSLGYRIKLLSVIKMVEGQVEARVQPTLIPESHLLAKVNGVFNSVMVHGDIVGETMYYGKGAGREPTASAVIGDIAEAARNIASGAMGRVPAFLNHSPDTRPRALGDIESRYYLRLTLQDNPGALGWVTQILGNNRVSIASIVQKEKMLSDYVPVIIITQPTTEALIQTALQDIDALEIAGASTLRYRIEDL